MEKLGLQRILPVYLGDEDSSNSKHGGLDEDFLFWSKLLLNAIELPVVSLDSSQTVRNILLYLISASKVNINNFSTL